MRLVARIVLLTVMQPPSSRGAPNDMKARPSPVPTEKLFHPCDPASLGFESTTELSGHDGVLGQDRALDAVHFGTRIGGDGYNVFALGTPGTGRLTVVRRILAKECEGRPVPADWCYVHNFQEANQPMALRLPSGRAVELAADMDQLVEDLTTTIPSAFQSEEYQRRAEKLEQELSDRRSEALNEVTEIAKQRHVRLLHTPEGFAFAPLNDDDAIIRPDEFKKLPEADRHLIEQTVEDLQRQLQRLIRQFPAWQKEQREKLKELDREIARFAVGHLIDGLLERYRDLPHVVRYLEAVEKNVVENVKDFRDEPSPERILFGGGPKKPELTRYRVNVFVDHSGAKCAPFIYEDLPAHGHLVGRIEHHAHMGTLTTDFTMIKPGVLHKANGGFLVLDARKLLMLPFAWETLKRALRAREVRVEPLERTHGLLSTSAPEPEPIPLDIKVVLIGDRFLYYLLHRYDPEFRDLFKVTADFEESLQNGGDAKSSYVELLASLISEHELMPFGADAIARVIEHSTRLAGDAEKLSLHLGRMSELLRESNHWAKESGSERVNRDHVQKALDARVYRSDRLRAHIYEAIEHGTLRIDTEGSRVGQVNALSVLDLGNFVFGQPSRITATTRLGEGKIIDIERETELGGRFHSKGVLILSNFLASRFAQKVPLSVAASLVFEQSYGMVDGDSASVAELCALLSALGNIPIQQQLAVTGSINQLGDVQAIGGVNQKVEGFYDVCKAKGLTGDQGVLVPASNVRHLMLRPDVVEAVQRGEFAVYAVERIDDAIEILSGVTAGKRGKDGKFPPRSVNGRVDAHLAELAQQRARFGKSNRRKSNRSKSNGGKSNRRKKKT